MSSVLDVEAIERDSVTTSIADVVDYLREHLGGSCVAYLAGLQDTKMLQRWKDGTEPQSKARNRLRTAYVATRMIAETFDDAVAEAWFFGSNSKLDDEAPARVLRQAQSVDDLRFVVPAARGFARAPE